VVVVVVAAAAAAAVVVVVSLMHQPCSTPQKHFLVLSVRD
jgi:hypothetical protein